MGIYVSQMVQWITIPVVPYCQVWKYSRLYINSGVTSRKFHRSQNHPVNTTLFSLNVGNLTKASCSIISFSNPSFRNANFANLWISKSWKKYLAYHDVLHFLPRHLIVTVYIGSLLICLEVSRALENRSSDWHRYRYQRTDAGTRK